MIDPGMAPDGGVWLVTGCRGFLGMRVLRRLLELRIPFRALIRPGSAREDMDALGAEFPKCRMEIIEGALGDRSALAGVKTVIHLAAAKSGSAAAQVASTVVSSERLYIASIEAGVSRFVLVSSFGVIGASDIPRGGLIDESTPMDLHPERRDPYSFAKHRQEQLAWKYYREEGLPLVVLRPGWIFGPGQSILGGRIGLKLPGIFLYLGGDNKLPLTFVENCADAVVHAGMVSGIEGETFCLVDDSLPDCRSIFRRYRQTIEALLFAPVPYFLLKLIACLNSWYSEATHGHLPAVFTPYKVSAMWAGHRFSNTKAKSVLGWMPRVPMQTALDLTFSAVFNNKKCTR